MNTEKIKDFYINSFTLDKQAWIWESSEEILCKIHLEVNVKCPTNSAMGSKLGITIQHDLN